MYLKFIYFVYFGIYHPSVQCKVYLIHTTVGHQYDYSNGYSLIIIAF